MWKRLSNYINKDVGNENEVKMYAVMMRIVLIIAIIYSVVCAASGFAFGHVEMGCFSLGCLLVSATAFHLTYCNQTLVATCVTSLMLLTVLTIHSYFYGLGIAVSQMIYVVVIMTCAIDYLKNIGAKIAVVASLLIYRVAIYTYLKSIPTLYEPSANLDSHWQTINMIACSAMIVSLTVISTSDFSQMREKLTQYNTKLRDVAGKDPLTGLYNRRSAIEYINGKIDGYKEGLYTSITIVMADIDHFKNINDTYGHDKGDEVLVELANTMGMFMRDKGLASRWGGEEFVLIFVDHNGDDTYGHLINLQREIAAKRFNFGGDNLSITLTYGLAEQSPDANLEDTIKEADEKLYIGKEKGRNIIIF